MTEEVTEIQTLRAEAKRLEAELKARPSRESVEAEVRKEIQREKVATVLFADRGQPAGLAMRYLAEIGDGQVDDNTVDDFLEGLGYDTTQPLKAVTRAPNMPDFEARPVKAEPDEPDLNTLAGRVTAAAANKPVDDLATQIAKAQSQEEIVAIMRKAGALER